MSELKNTFRNQSCHNILFLQDPQLSPRSQHHNLDGSNISLKISNVFGHPLQQISSNQSPHHFIEDNFLESYSVPKSAKLPNEKSSLITENFRRLEVTTRGKKRSDNSLRDLNRSLANLVRTNESVSSIENLIGKNGTVPKEGHMGPRLSSFQPIHHSKLLSKTLRTPNSKDYQQVDPVTICYTENTDESLSNEFAPPRKGKYNHKKHYNQSNVKFNNFQVQESKINFEDYQRRFSSNLQPKYLLTEEDSLIERSDFLSDRLSLNLLIQIEDNNKKNEKQDKKLNSSGKQNFLKKTSASNNMLSVRNYMGAQKSYSDIKEPNCLKYSHLNRGKLKSDKDALNFAGYRKYENQDILDLDNISDDVKYGERGVGYGTYGRQTAKEGISFPKEAEKFKKRFGGQVKKINGHSAARGRHLTELQKGTLNTWKKDLLEIKNDMDRRKPSYEKLHNFFKKYDADRTLVPKAASKYLQDDVRKTSRKSLSPYSQKTQPTLSLQTQQIQSEGLDRLVSPSFCVTNNEYTAPNLSTYNENISNRDKNNEKQREIRGFLEMKTTEATDEQKVQKEDLTIQESPFDVKTNSDQEVNRRMYDVNLGSFVHGNMGCKVSCKSPCCSATSGCQIF